MKKVFYTNVSQKAVKGIYRLYDGTGAKVEAYLNPGRSDATVVVTKPDRAPKITLRGAHAAKRKDADEREAVSA